MVIKMERLLSIKETAEFLNVSEQFLYIQIRAKKIPALRIGRTWRFDPVDLRAWLKGKRNKLRWSYDTKKKNQNIKLPSLKTKAIGSLSRKDLYEK